MGGYAARVVIFVKAPEAFVPELPDNHEVLYGITVHPSSDFQRREKAACRVIASCFLEIHGLA